ncbi:hypothetical protein SAMN02745887_03652 [Chitinimonas taiwanensis DSM 18899]|uniref:Uncharacterized protein n=1 Tax=Chitinimonas taiwanensis DSM 18899 TaxID=1121279 RepID=A0A1K2HRU9_9NEIS|nr:hypothetical protein SAMN02745887_03652 [Chitinimonas taiwanensis DSM 18899]
MANKQAQVTMSALCHVPNGDQSREQVAAMLFICRFNLQVQRL